MIESSERIKNIITEMIFKDSYWGYLFSKLNRSVDLTIPSLMGVTPEIDGTITLLYNPKYIELVEDDFLSSAIEHEGIHILNSHIPRLLRIISDEIDKEKKNKKIKKWNYGADCAVNTLININKSYMIGNFEFELVFPDRWNLPPKKSAEYYFEKIPDDENNNESGDGQDGSGKMNIDDHKSWIKNNSKVSDISSLASRMEQYTNSIMEESYNNVRSKGNLPNYISEKISELLRPPQIPYYQMISKLVKGSRLSKQKRAYTRINKKRVYTFFLDNKHLPIISPFPGKTKDFSFNISAVLDTSGSMSKDDVMEGLSGIKNLIENDKDCKTTVIESDTIIQKEYVVTRLRDIDYTIKGRGGTELFPALQRCKELNSDVTLVFTDGYTDDINSINRYLLPKKIIYILTSTGSSKLLDMTGRIVRLPERRKR
jgi:predicted metal-dependent peptidase